VGGGKEVGKGCRRANMVQKNVYIHVYKWKVVSVETIPGMGGGGMKENGGRGEFKYDIFDIL
jgi:hypothetical protein